MSDHVEHLHLQLEVVFDVAVDEPCLRTQVLFCVLLVDWENVGRLRVDMCQEYESVYVVWISKRIPLRRWWML